MHVVKCTLYVCYLYLLWSIFNSSIGVLYEIEFLVGFGGGQIERHVGPVLKQPDLGWSGPLLPSHHDQTFELDVASERDVEQQFFVSV